MLFSVKNVSLPVGKTLCVEWVLSMCKVLGFILMSHTQKKGFLKDMPHQDTINFFSYFYYRKYICPIVMLPIHLNRKFMHMVENLKEA